MQILKVLFVHFKIKKAVKKIEEDTKKKWRARKVEALKDRPD